MATFIDINSFVNRMEENRKTQRNLSWQPRDIRDAGPRINMFFEKYLDTPNGKVGLALMGKAFGYNRSLSKSELETLLITQYPDEMLVRVLDILQTAGNLTSQESIELNQFLHEYRRRLVADMAEKPYFSENRRLPLDKRFTHNMKYTSSLDTLGLERKKSKSTKPKRKPVKCSCKKK